MRVKLTIDRTEKFTDCALHVLKKEFSKRLGNRFHEFSLIIPRAGTVGLFVSRADKNDKNDVGQAPTGNLGKR